MIQLLLNGAEPEGRGSMVDRLRQVVSWALLGYFWLSAIIVVLASFLSGGSPLFVALPLVFIGAIATAAVHSAPSRLATRLMMTVAINSTWMFGLYVASDIHNGEYMLEVHMLYFINTSIILAYVCWRSVLMTTVAALFHHSVLTLLSPELVWPTSTYASWHLTNHYVLGTINCLGGIFIAVTLKKFLNHLEASQAESQFRSLHDDLTGLLNRRGLRNAFRTLIENKTEQSCLTLFQIDLDGFKDINDTAGHAAGDKLLELVGACLQEISPARSVLARIGGDEFVVASPDIETHRDTTFVKDLSAWFRRPELLSQFGLRVTASIGITTSHISGDRLADMMVDADIALYEAKKTGKNRAVIFNPGLKSQAHQLLQTSEEFSLALEQDEIEPFFQTQHDIRTGAVVGVEVLARWRHPVKGLLTPSAFMDAVKESGRAATLDAHILEKALLGIQTLEASGAAFAKVSFNISFQRLIDPELIQSVRSLPATKSQIAFELVESVFFDNLSDDEVNVVTTLRDLGIRIEIDDFGTGHASLIALTRLKPDLLKIDRALISPLTTQPAQAKLVTAIVDMAQALKIEVLAEGVETDEEINRLRMLGVRYAQGYAYSKPMSLADLKGYVMRETA
ncbi:putative bifunctional diguanylate cyclase/phosphodiesterase [Roseibium aggregatum]|uniref:putative bifunctional diguanylate cyclase/phosphodiesterase n=1 Tax=Roseibium aggregatum TaxID=187304 RepID=UPI001E293799|nr:bifunctional diguanylate cyclase/phosphodiesterase [Roseibium aggregatum]UES42120.1 EAL domain-containing protein [Roseibium aggregatum]